MQTCGSRRSRPGIALGLTCLLLAGAAGPAGGRADGLDLGDGLADGVLRAGPRDAVDVAWAPGGAHVAHARPGGIDVDGVRVVRTGGVDAAPPRLTWNADGTRLAFLATRLDGWQTVYAVAADGSGLRELLPGAPGATGIRAVERIAWLDPRRVLFSVHAGTGVSDVGEVDATTGRAGPQCTAAAGHRWLAGTPWGVEDGYDGAAELRWPPPRDTYAGACAYRHDERRRCVVFDGWSGKDGAYLATDWAPAANCWDPPEEGTRLVRVERTATGRRVRAVAAGLRRGAERPDGTRIAALRLARGALQLVLLDAADGRQLWSRPLGRVAWEPYFRDALPLPPVFSPDGAWIVVHDGAGSVLAVRAEDGKTARTLTDAVPCAAEWSPDGATLALRPLRPEDPGAAAGADDGRAVLAGFLEPAAGPDLALDDAALVEKQFRARLAQRDLPFAEEVRRRHAEFLWATGRTREADAEYRAGLARIREGDLRDLWTWSYADFLACTGRRAEADRLLPRPAHEAPPHDPAASLGGVRVDLPTPGQRAAAGTPYDPCTRVRPPPDARPERAAQARERGRTALPPPLLLVAF